MAILINRNPVGRLICLHSLLKYVWNQYGDSSFSIKSLKYDPEKEHSILEYCPLLVKKSSWSTRVCPYLQNPISDAKCYLTQSLLYDTQKSKSASDAMNAMDGLNWVNRHNSDSKITELGKKLALMNFEDVVPYLKDSLLSYGPFVGFLWKTLQNENSGVISRNNVFVGFPRTEEVYFDGTSKIILSTGSQDDTNTRTRSIFFTWALTAGLLNPIDDSIDVAAYILGGNWNMQKFKVNFSKDILLGHAVTKPLEYNWLTKDTKALRERNQALQRNTTMQLETKVKNRRFSIVYLLNEAFEKNMDLSLDLLIKELVNNDSYVINRDTFQDVMNIEKDIATITGIPFIDKSNLLTPVTHINKEILSRGVPTEVIEYQENLINKVLVRR